MGLSFLSVPLCPPIAASCCVSGKENFPRWRPTCLGPGNASYCNPGSGQDEPVGYAEPQTRSPGCSCQSCAASHPAGWADVAWYHLSKSVVYGNLALVPAVDKFSVLLLSWCESTVMPD